MRVDAARNLSRITEAARELIAREGPEVTMDALAARAGVAVGTLYRHFPTKQHLVAAVVEESIVRIAELSEAAAERVAGGADAADELGALFRAVAADQPSDRAVKQAAAALGVAVDVQLDAAPPGSATDRATVALGRVLDAARASGRVRPDRTVEDLALMLAQLPDDPSGRAAERYLDIMLAGLLERA